MVFLLNSDSTTMSNSSMARTRKQRFTGGGSERAKRNG